jgi:acetyl esterase/lipase
MVAFRYAQRLGARVIFPNWTLAPQTCASEFAIAAVELFLSIAEDTQYENMDICLSGMSAGGWCALRTLLAACEAACESDLERRKRLTIALDRVSNVILFCPAVDLVMDQEAERLSQYVRWLTETC